MQKYIRISREKKVEKLCSEQQGKQKLLLQTVKYESTLRLPYRSKKCDKNDIELKDKGLS